MTGTEFTIELEKVRNRFDWHLETDQGHTPERRTRPRLRIRAVFREQSDAWRFDPIGAVCYVLTGQRHDADSWMDSANALDLSLIDAADLTAAANDVTWWMGEGRRGPEPHLKSLREHLLAVLDLPLEASTPRTPIMARVWSRWRGRTEVEPSQSREA